MIGAVMVQGLKWTAGSRPQALQVGIATEGAMTGLYRCVEFEEWAACWLLRREKERGNVVLTRVPIEVGSATSQ